MDTLGQGHAETVSVFHKLPPELISHIFLQCLSDNVGGLLKDPCRRSDEFMPITLGPISQSWRQIAWSTSQLWTQLPIVHPGFKTDLGTEIQLVEQLIARAKNNPLAIYLEIFYDHRSSPPSGPNEYESLTTTYRPLLTIIAQSSEQWQDVYLKIPFPFIQHLAECAIMLPIIRTLDLQPIGLTYEIHVNPAPRRIILRRILPRNLNIKWSSVTHVDLDVLATSECMKLMQLVPLIESFSIARMEADSNDLPQASPSIALSRLVYLDIASPIFCTLGVFLSAINSPNLVRFCCGSLVTGIPDEYPAASFIRFLQRSERTLRYLKIGTTPCTFPSFATLLPALQATPSVTHLAITEKPKDHFPRLDYTQDLILNPLLQHLTGISHGGGDGEIPTSNPTITPILLDLQFLELTAGNPFGWNEFMPRLFDSTRESDSRRPRRPLKSLRITEWVPNNDSNPHPGNRIPRETLLRILDFQAQGTEIIWRNKREVGPVEGQPTGDLFAESRRFHGIL